MVSIFDSACHLSMFTSEYKYIKFVYKLQTFIIILGLEIN